MIKTQFESISKWQKETFGEATALSKVEHLHQEVIELHDDLVAESEGIKMEFADCFILLFGAAASHGMSYEDICNCIDEKMKINKLRKWGKPDDNGVINHLKNN